MNQIEKALEKAQNSIKNVQRHIGKRDYKEAKAKGNIRKTRRVPDVKISKLDKKVIKELS